MTDLTHNLIFYCKQVYSGIMQLRNLRLSHLRKVFSLLGKREKIALITLTILAIATFYLSLRNFYFQNSIITPAFGGQYTEGMLGQPNYINPLLAYQETDLALINLVFSGLYKYDNSGMLVPDIADGQPQISEDQKQYTINLKKNVKWHSGKSLTADDVVYTLQVLKDASYKSPLRNMWLSTNVEKLGDYTVKFTTKDISGPFIHNLTLPILPKYLWSRVDAKSFLLSENNLQAIGSGPYAIKEIKKLSSGKVEQITLNSHTNYHNNRAKLETIVVKFYEDEEDILNSLHSKEISGYGFVALGSNLFLEKDREDVSVINLPLPQYQVAFFNLNNKILAEQPVRQALLAATDRRQIIKDVFKDQAVLPTSPLLLNSQSSREPQTEQPDLTKAAQLLENAGWKIDPKTNIRTKKNQTFEITITTNDYLLNSKAAETLANQWRSLNIKVNLTILPTKQLTDSVIRPRSFDVLIFPQKFDADPDPFVFWHSSQVKDPGFNLTGFSSPQTDKLITEARTTTNTETRATKYREFNELIMEKVPVIFLDQTVYTYAVDKELKNINLRVLYEPSQRFYDVEGWYMQEDRKWK